MYKWDSYMERGIGMKKTAFIKEDSILILCLFLLLLTGCSKKNGSIYGPPLVVSPQVVSRYEEGVEAGFRILNSGGNAFDAFVGVTALENVISPGAVSLSGVLGTLIYHAESNTVTFLDAGYNSVLALGGEYDPNDPVLGKAVAVPGIVAGLREVHRRYGRLSWAEVLQPAIELARRGFTVSEGYALSLEIYAQILQRTEYGRQTFFPGDLPLQPGDTLRLPELENFLTDLAEQGSSYMYTGQWAEQCVDTIQAEGGLMTMEDLASYRPTWGEPWAMTYRGYDICASSGRVLHCLWALLALKTLEHTNIQPMGHFSESADALEVMVRTARAVDEESWIWNAVFQEDRDLVNSRLTWNYTNTIWDKVEAALGNVSSSVPTDHHTLCSIVVDREGNVVAAKHSINSEFWGSGLFVQGIPLNASAMLAYTWNGPGKRRLQGVGNFLIFKEGKMRSALGMYDRDGQYAAFQFLVNLIDFDFPADMAAELPRFGGYVYDENGIVDYSTHWLNESISQVIVDALRERGLFFEQVDFVHGVGCMLKFHLDGTTSTGWGR